MVVSYKILVHLTGLTITFEVLEKFKATYEITIPLKQVHLMCKLVCMYLTESKSATNPLFAFRGILSQLQDSRLPLFDDKLKALFLLMTLPDLWEKLVVHCQITLIFRLIA